MPGRLHLSRELRMAFGTMLNKGGMCKKCNAGKKIDKDAHFLQQGTYKFSRFCSIWPKIQKRSKNLPKLANTGDFFFRI